MERIYIALGANLAHPDYGSPADSINKAVNILAKTMDVTARSPIYRTVPIPISDQPDYANAVIKIRSSLQPSEILAVLHEIENMFGRIRQLRNEARKLDLDIVDYGGKIVKENNLDIPHPRMHERLFVLYPLRDIAPNWHHPIIKLSIDELINKAPQGGISLWK